MARPGRPSADPADIADRKAEFVNIIDRMNVPPAKIGDMIGISAGTVRRYLAPNISVAPSALALRNLRRGFLQHLESREAAAIAAAEKARLARIEYEREIA